MAKPIQRRPWQISERDATPGEMLWQRRRLLKAAGADLYPARREIRFALDRPLTAEIYAASYNNFYEFSTLKSRVYRKASKLRTHPWQIEIAGLIEKPRIFDMDELVRAMTLEERLHRFRCVETWAMAVPWTGFSLQAFIRLPHRRET